jgi:hypothetical protein
MEADSSEDELVEGWSESPVFPLPPRLAVDLFEGEPEDGAEPPNPRETALSALVVPHHRLL